MSKKKKRQRDGKEEKRDCVSVRQSAVLYIHVFCKNVEDGISKSNDWYI